MNLELVNVCNEHTEIRREIETLKIRSLIRKRARQREIVKNIIVTITIIALLILTCIKIFSTEPRYAIASETTNGNHYVYVTERICEVTETETENNIVTVSYNGNLYSFYGNGYEVGTEIICQFTDEMEIIGVVE